MFENPVAKRTAIAAAIGAVVAIPLPFIGPIVGAIVGGGIGYFTADKALTIVKDSPRTRAADRAVEVALERHDQLGEQLRLDPFPVAELGMLGGDIDVGVAAEEPGQVPVLQLALPLAAPQARGDRVGMS